MRALGIPAGVGVMNKDWLPNLLKLINQDVMYHAVPEVGCEDLPQLRFLSGEKNRARRVVGPILKLLLKFKNILFGVDLESQRVIGIAFLAPTVEITPIDVSKRKNACL